MKKFDLKLIPIGHVELFQNVKQVNATRSEVLTRIEATLLKQYCLLWFPWRQDWLLVSSYHNGEGCYYCQSYKQTVHVLVIDKWTYEDPD